MGNPLPSQQKGTAEGCEYCSNLFQTGLPFFIGYTNWFSLVAKHTYLILSPHQPQGVKLVASTGNQGQRKYVIPCHPLFSPEADWSWGVPGNHQHPERCRFSAPALGHWLTSSPLRLAPSWRTCESSLHESSFASLAPYCAAHSGTMKC